MAGENCTNSFTKCTPTKFYQDYQINKDEMTEAWGRFAYKKFFEKTE